MKRYIFISVSKSNVVWLVSSAFLIFIILFTNIYFFMDLRQSLTRPAYETSRTFTASSGFNARLAIIIDDFGQNRAGVNEMMSIKRHITLAVMPFLAFSKSDAQKAHDNGFEVIIHLPLEASGGKLSWVGPRPILSASSDSEVTQIVNDSFDEVPYAVGANIHMGSKAGDDERIISDILDVIKSKNMYFVDSRASRHPIAKKIADTKGVVCYDRDVFIDGKKPKEYIVDQLKKAEDIALKKGYAIAIGHVGVEGGKVTAQAINEMLPEFDRQKIKLVFISELGNK